MTLGEAVLETTRELDLRFRDLLIRRAALLPQGDPLRLSDRQIRGLLEYDPGVRGGRRPDPGEEDDDWDSPENGDMITHLALTAHPSPIPLLRDVPRLQALALTSLDLAYCTLPADLDRLVTVLPSGLRALGLRGVRAPTSPDVMKLWPHGMGSLGRKLVVLRTLDLSEFPVNSAAPVHLHLGSGPNEEWHLGVHPLLALLKPLLQPAGAHLPSLRVLRLAGILDEPPDTSTLHSSRLYLHEDQTRKNRMTTDRVSEMLKSGGERSHWVEVQWE
ncbi:hypothetical protein Q8F55_003891 [Vanrija albida]|uniref:F-box domain-containing protein n=1 Tax=Vanrija albida TaxID=181172 RepID=A0ABR3Q5S7_9TREE